MDEETKVLVKKIKVARKYARVVFDRYEKVVEMLSGSLVSGYELEFPVGEPDIMRVYTTIYGRKCGEPVVYRLAFRPRLRWVGVFHPLGFELEDIEVIQ